MSRSGFFEGAVFGLVAGLTVGLLLAPESGEETRKKIKKLKDDNEHLFTSSKEKTEDMINKTLGAIESGFENLSSMVDKKTKASRSAKGSAS